VPPLAGQISKGKKEKKENKKNERKKKKRQTKKKEQQKERSQVGARNYFATTFPRARVYRLRCVLAALSPIMPTFPRSLLPSTRVARLQCVPRPLLRVGWWVEVITLVALRLHAQVLISLHPVS